MPGIFFFNGDGVHEINERGRTLISHRVDSQQHDIKIWGRIAARNRSRRRRQKIATALVCAFSLMGVSTIVEQFGTTGILVLAILTLMMSAAWVGRKS